MVREKLAPNGVLSYDRQNEQERVLNMRRAEHEKDRDFAEKVIDECRYMTLCLVDEEGRPYCVPLSPVRRDSDIYFHCATAGRKLDIMRRVAMVLGKRLRML